MNCRVLIDHEIIQEGDYAREKGISPITKKNYRWIIIATGHPLFGMTVREVVDYRDYEFGRAEEKSNLFPDGLVSL